VGFTGCVIDDRSDGLRSGHNKSIFGGGDGGFVQKNLDILSGGFGKGTSNGGVHDIKVATISG